VRIHVTRMTSHPVGFRAKEERHMQAKGYLRTPQAADYLGVSISTLRRGRVTGEGPQFRVLGKNIVAYAVHDLDNWASREVLQSTSQRSVA
jgi:predicted DNA-binding transcriptional regulator AlpA